MDYITIKESKEREAMHAFPKASVVSELFNHGNHVRATVPGPNCFQAKDSIPPACTVPGWPAKAT
jgi:hypothetical protein